MKKQIFLTRTLDSAILISIIIGAGILIALPFLKAFYFDVAGLLSSYPVKNSLMMRYFACLKMPPYPLVMSAIYFTAFLYFFIAVDARKLTKSILCATPFAMGNVMALRRVAVLAFAECLIFSVLTIYLFLMQYSIFATMITLIIAIASAFVSIIGAVLSQLLRSAIKIKNENDLTI